MNIIGGNSEELLANFAKRTQAQLVGDSQIPLYFQLARVLQMFIRENLLQPGERFPSEEAVGICFDVSRPTVNKAIQELLTQGWLYRIRGRGTFLKEDPRVRLALLGASMSPTEQFSPKDLHYKFVQRRRVRADLQIAQSLRLEPGAPLLFMRRLRLIHDHPLLVCDSILSIERFPGLVKQSLIQGSLYTTLEQVFNCPIVRSERCVEASEVIDQEVATLLEIPLLSPVLLLTGTTFTKGNEPIEYMRSYLKEGVSLESTVRRSALKIKE